MYLRRVETNVLVVDGECVSWNGNSYPSGVVVVKTTGKTTFRAFVKFVSSGQTFMVDVRSSDTILNVKERIEAISGLQVQYQELVYARKKLENCRYYCAGPSGVVRRGTAQGYGIGSNVTLHLMLTS